MDTRREGDGGTNGESSMETHTLTYATQIASGNVPCDAGSSDQCCDNPGGWDGLGGGREAQEGGAMCIPMTDSC